MNDPLDRIAAYLEGALNESQVAELEAWLREDRSRSETFVRQAMLDTHLTELMHEQNVEHVSADLSGDSQFGLLLESSFLSKAPANIDASAAIQTHANKLTRQQYISALTYVLKHTFTPNRITILSTAAALLLGLLLAIVLLTGPDDIAPIAETPGTQSEPQPVDSDPPDSTPAVATITATHNADWFSPQAEGASAPGSALTIGSKLHAHQRLTLTAGFAEITTNDGAIAILEAPATVELLDHDNALRLYTGKLVGICETPSSKGFIVETAHATITDIGTEFGVIASPFQRTRLVVFDGEVEVATPQADGRRENAVRIITNQSATIQQGDQQVAIADWATGEDSQGLTFTRRITDAMHLVKTEGNAHFLQEMPALLRVGQQTNETHALVFAERSGLVLDETTPIDWLASGGARLTVSALPQSRTTLDAGTPVDSFLLHIDREATEIHVARIEGRLTFEKPILGLILSTETLNASDGLFGAPGTSYERIIGRGMTGESVSDPDRIEISEDGLSLSFSIAVSQIDQMRIIVQSTRDINQF